MSSQPPYQPYPPAQVPAVDQPQQQQQAKRSKGLSWLVEIAVTVVLAFALYWVIQTFVVQTYRVEGESMDLTLANGQHLLIDKLTPRFDSYSRGDIVVLHPPDQKETSTPYIKRVIGVAGDHVEVRDGGVWINGSELTEPYVAPGAITEPLTDVDTWDVGSNEVFVMGDNREQSVDSREFGVVATNEVIGRAWLRFWPLDSLGLLQVPTYPDLPPTASPGP
jgi:signal peptidase I